MGGQYSQCNNVDLPPQDHGSVSVFKRVQSGSSNIKGNSDQNNKMINFRDKAFDSLKFVQSYALKYEPAINQLLKYFEIRNVKKSKIFQGKLDEKNQPIGIGLYFKVKKGYYHIYLGIIDNGKQIGAGMKIKIDIDQNGRNKNINQEILFIADWQKKQNLEGCFINKREKQQTVYVGVFGHNMQMKKGKLMVIAQGAIVKEYNGQFQDNQFQDKNGELTIAGKYQYKGAFYKNKKSGFGIERDFIKKTTYIGEFADNEKEGFGEIIYDGQKKIKLRGFWVEGIMKNQQGVFVDAKGELIEVYSTSTQA